MKPRVVTISFTLLGTALVLPIASAYATTTHKTHRSTSLSASSARNGLVGSTHARAAYVSYTHASYSHHKLRYANLKGGKVRYAWGGLQCVPFARAHSGIEIKGNAANWWDAAAGVYARGARPEPGSVLNFRPTWGMRLGHVAVVTAVLDPRTIQIEHANWSKGSVARNVEVQDVSAANDWSQVRVGLGHTGKFGSVYPTYGFIYDRPDTGAMVANDITTTDAPARASIDTTSDREVAEAPPVVGGRAPARKPLILDLPARGFDVQ